MIRSILAAAILSLGVVSVALAFTPRPATSPQLAATSDLIQVKSKGYKSGGYKDGKWHHGKGHGHRYADSHSTNTPRKAGATTTIVPIAGSIVAA